MRGSDKFRSGGRKGYGSDRLCFYRTLICLIGQGNSELPPKFRLPRVRYNRSHDEREDDEDTEAAIHGRVQGIGGEASPRRADSRSGGQGVRIGQTNASELSQGGRGRHAKQCWRQGGHTRADGTVTTASRERATEARERNPEKATVYFARDTP
jgi:hypothetical protein